MRCRSGRLGTLTSAMAFHGLATVQMHQLWRSVGLLDEVDLAGRETLGEFA